MATLELQTPETVEPPIMVWDIAFAAAQPSAEPPAFVYELTTNLGVSTDARDIVVTVDGPGTITPTSPNRVRQATGEFTTNWRWAAPIRAQAPPYDLELRATATYHLNSQQQTIEATQTVRATAPAPPAEDAFVSDLEFSWATNGYGPIERDQAGGELGPGDGGPIRLDGQAFDKGLGVNARSLAGFHLGGVCTRFTATIGIDDVRDNAGSVVFRVIGDGRVRYESGVMRGSTPAEQISLDMTGVQQLDLVVDPTADGQGNDGADWAAARLERG